MKIPFLFAFTLVMNTGHSQSKHTISIQSGLFHSYFDQTPLFNFKYTSKDQGIFHGMHLGSVGIEYAYSINSKNSVGVEYSLLNTIYKETWAQHELGDACSRSLQTFYLKYQRNHNIFNKTSLNYGAGISYRTGEATLFTIPGTSGGDFMSDYNESNFGLNAFVGLSHQLTHRLSLFYKFDFRSVVYFVNHEELNANPELHPGYPNRFDLSLKLGLSFHF